MVRKTLLTSDARAPCGGHPVALCDRFVRQGGGAASSPAPRKLERHTEPTGQAKLAGREELTCPSSSSPTRTVSQWSSARLTTRSSSPPSPRLSDSVQSESGIPAKADETDVAAALPVGVRGGFEVHRGQVRAQRRAHHGAQRDARRLWPGTRGHASAARRHHQDRAGGHGAGGGPPQRQSGEEQSTARLPQEESAMPQRTRGPGQG